MPLVPFPQLVGPSYQSASLAADVERSMNLYPEVIESGEGRNKFYLRKTSGLRVFCTLPGTPCQAAYTINGRMFFVAGAELYEILQGGTFRDIGSVGGGVTTMTSNGYQLVIGNAQYRWVYDLTGATQGIQRVAGVAGAVPSLGQLDTYTLAVTPSTNQLGFSAPDDATSWDGLDFIGVEGSGDFPIAMYVINGYIFVFGRARAQYFYDAGDQFTVFQQVPQGYIEEGISAPASICEFDETLAWLGGSPKGTPIAWRLAGLSPQRISTHAIEAIWAGYTTVADAYAFAFKEQGHTFYQLTFPSCNPDFAGAYHGATWVYDAATKLWHERGYWNEQYGMYERHRAACFASNWGMNFVGDYVNGNVYVLDPLTYSDNGNPIRWLRRCPHVSDSLTWLFFPMFQLDCQVGVGLDGTQQGTQPTVILRYSNDGGNSWSNEHAMSMGAIGAFQQRVIWRQLGRGRDRVWEVSGTDPVAVALINAYMDVKKGTG